MDIEFKEGAQLPQYSHAIEIPAHLRGMADAFMEESLRAGTVERCNDGEACAPAHFVEKRDAEGNIALCVFGKRGPKILNFELLFLHGFSSKNREILHKAVLTPQEYEDYFFGKNLRK